MEDEENSTSPFVEDDISEQFREDPADDEMAHDLEEYPGAAAIVDLCGKFIMSRSDCPTGIDLTNNILTGSFLVEREIMYQDNITC